LGDLPVQSGCQQGHRAHVRVRSLFGQDALRLRRQRLGRVAIPQQVQARSRSPQVSVGAVGCRYQRPVLVFEIGAQRIRRCIHVPYRADHPGI